VICAAKRRAAKEVMEKMMQKLEARGKPEKDPDLPDP
jgi:hypothetical protein